jgi:hypothetical protein
MNPKILEIAGWMSEPELLWLHDVASKVPDKGLIVEIGAWKGRSSAAIYTGAKKTVTCVSIDTWKGTPSEMHAHGEALEVDLHEVYKQNMLNLGIKVSPYLPFSAYGYAGPYYMIGDSVESAANIPDGLIDWLFVDGDHSKTGADIDAYLPKMKPDGLVTGHDYFCFFETIQQEIHKRFFIHQLFQSIWVKYANNQPPGWYT